MRIPLAALLVAALAAPLPAQAPSRTVSFRSATGAAGTATLTAAPKGLLIHVEAEGLSPGWHAIHVHAVGDCSDAGFKKAGGHVHGDGAAVHGLLNPAATDRGDLPNIYADADGHARAELFTPMLALADGQGDRLNILDADGAALVIHANKDDYTSQPIGGAGDRVACAVVK
ncbi:superoxide dismutase family protein [Sphingomonas morindae]|uniref:Superoxide dismutase [Cu-Zn] n=1 Tax=Sphingomonas morindae TaxID=1541170 RepID=A0ABY4XB74_9SPHN|nr:superoxide dismutase family protein [Sphingomonas morindae]USI74222.1 superoxide dismutase family protein [Sphingomonas morindae]